MQKNTLEEIKNDYKEAIRNKFKIEKEEGKHSHYLSNPSQALLRNLCWEIFTSNPKTDDLNIYRNFFRTDFTSEENTSTQYTDKFRKVSRFYKEEQEPANISTVELAAILVDFEPRPFGKFRKKHDEEEQKLIEELRDTDFSKANVSPGNILNEIEVEKNINSKNEEETDQIQKLESVRSEESENEELENEESEITPTSNFVNAGGKIKSKILRYSAITLILFGLGIIIFLTLFKKDCMQWSGDHFEEVSCDLKIEGIGTFNIPEPYDERVINLRRIKVSDTTAFFKNEKAIIWYAKVGDSVQFFNTHGNHPETGRALRPVTQYIINKYVVKH